MATTSTDTIDLHHRPSSYFWPHGLKKHLLARVKVTVPQKLTKAEKAALEGYDKVLRERPRDRAFNR